MIVWPLINVIAGLSVAVILAYRLAREPQLLTVMERIGMGLVGAGCVLTIGPLLSVAPTPYEDWSGTLLRVGCAVFFVGQLLRHRHNNDAMIRAARRHKARR